MANDFLKVYLESNFQYIGSDVKLGADDKSLQNMLEQELLDYKLYFEQGKWLDSEIQHIADELEKTGKLFAKNQGFGEGLKIGTRDSGRLKIMGTGNLVTSIHAKPTEVQGGAKTIMFWNDAKNERNQYYAGHMEYGFHDRGGNFIPARPFMRPALYAVAEGSKGRFRNIMQGLLGNLWTGKGFQGVSELSFGTKAMSPQSNFWSNSKSFTGQLSQKSNLGQLTGQGHRQKMSMMRRKNPNSVLKKRGYRLGPNKNDYMKTRSQSGSRALRGVSSQKPSSNKPTNVQSPQTGPKVKTEPPRVVQSKSALDKIKQKQEERKAKGQQNIKDSYANRPGKNGTGKGGKGRGSKPQKETIEVLTFKNGKVQIGQSTVSKEFIDKYYMPVSRSFTPIASITKTKVRMNKDYSPSKSNKPLYIHK